MIRSKNAIPFNFPVAAVTNHGPVHQTYTTYHQRLASFLPTIEIPFPDNREMASAGFFFMLVKKITQNAFTAE